MFRKVALNTDLENAISSPDLSSLVGKEGTAATVLRPSGKVSVDGVFYDGISESGFIEKGARSKLSVLRMHKCMWKTFKTRPFWHFLRRDALI